MNIFDLVIDKGVVTSLTNINVKDIYDKVDKYCKRNYISPTMDRTGNYYNIKYEDIYYSLFKVDSYEEYYKISLSDKVDNYIDYNDIINNYKQNTTSLVENEYRNLRNCLINLKKLNISNESIEHKVKKLLKNN